MNTNNSFWQFFLAGNKLFMTSSTKQILHSFWKKLKWWIIYWSVFLNPMKTNPVSTLIKPSLFYPFIFLFFFTNQFLFLLQDLKDGFLFRSAWIKTRYVIFNITMSLVLKLSRMKFFVGEEVYFFNDPTIWWPDFSKLFSFKWILHYLDLITELIFNF